MKYKILIIFCRYNLFKLCVFSEIFLAAFCKAEKIKFNFSVNFNHKFYKLSSVKQFIHFGTIQR